MPPHFGGAMLRFQWNSGRSTWRPTRLATAARHKACVPPTCVPEDFFYQATIRSLWHCQHLCVNALVMAGLVPVKKGVLIPFDAACAVRGHGCNSFEET